VYWRPDGVVHRKVAGVICSTFHRGSCLSLCSCLLGVVTAGREPVVAFLRGNRLERDLQLPRAGNPGREPPGTVSAGRPLIT
jgi:hypothetical protein